MQIQTLLYQLFRHHDFGFKQKKVVSYKVVDHYEHYNVFTHLLECL